MRVIHPVMQDIARFVSAEVEAHCSATSVSICCKEIYLRAEMMKQLTGPKLVQHRLRTIQCLHQFLQQCKSAQTVT